MRNRPTPRRAAALPLLAAAGALIAAVPAPGRAQITIDGTAEAAYGSALAVQNNRTAFGDSNLGLPGFANGSELNQAFGTVQNGTLFLVFAGNLESNFNKLEIFLDTQAGGQNRLRGDNANVDFNGLNRMGDDGSGNGLTFDEGFAADFYLSFTGGNDPYRLFGNFATLPTGGGGEGGFLGDTAALSDGTLTGANDRGIRATINNSNTGGVTSGGGTGAGVITGLEVAIPLALIGLPASDIRITAFINGGGHDFVSNQVLGGIPTGFGNLAEPRTVNFANIAGDQFFTVAVPASAAVPEPSAALLVGPAALSALVLARRRRSAAR